MSKDLATQQHSNALAIIDEDIDDGLTTEDLEIPKINLLQAMSKACTDGVGRPGQYQNSISGDVIDGGFEAIVVRKFTSAVYFKDKKMQCKSSDGVTSVNGDLCLKCPFGVYHGEWKDGVTPPACNKQVNFIIVPRESIETGEFNPMIMSFMKEGLKVAKEVIKRAANEKQFKRLPMHHRWYKIASMKKDNPKGSFFLPTFTAGEALGDPQMAVANQVASFIASKKDRIRGHDDETSSDVDTSLDTKTFDEV